MAHTGTIFWTTQKGLYAPPAEKRKQIKTLETEQHLWLEYRHNDQDAAWATAKRMWGGINQETMAKHVTRTLTIDSYQVFQSYRYGVLTNWTTGNGLVGFGAQKLIGV